jgi:hypothetical protein
MNKKEKALKDLKDSLEKEHGRTISDPELEKVESFLRTLAKLQVSVFLEDERRQAKLRESPGGFHMDEPGYSCSICGGQASGENSWFDEYGLKCGYCQGGINRGEIPAWLGQRKEEWYSGTELEMYFNLKGAMLRKWIKKGLLVGRTVTAERKGRSLQVFLIAENNKMLPPKELLKGGTVKEVVNGREEYVFAPWYWFVDPKEHLKGYGIGECLRVVPMESNKDGDKKA